MGNASSQIVCTLTPAEVYFYWNYNYYTIMINYKYLQLDAFSKSTIGSGTAPIFSAEEVKSLWFHFNTINAFNKTITLKLVKYIN